MTLAGNGIWPTHPANDMMRPTLDVVRNTDTFQMIVDTPWSGYSPPQEVDATSSLQISPYGLPREEGSTRFEHI
jgi:hypothetical protein